MSAAFALGNLAGVIAIRPEDAALTAELQAGSEEAFSQLIAQYHAPVYNLVSRVLNDPSDAPDITQDVFIKVFRGIGGFHGDSSLRTWIYRIALREASNQRRWWSRHRGREVTLETQTETDGQHALCLKDTLADEHESPFEAAAHEEVRARVELELRQLPEPFRTVVILRDLEGMAYDEIAEILGANLGTVKSRLVRGRAMLRVRLGDFVTQARTRAEQQNYEAGVTSIRSAKKSRSAVQSNACEEAI
jgi:RNA polymerase sigma-70 factor (ECF subfamily)